VRDESKAPPVKKRGIDLFAGMDDDMIEEMKVKRGILGKMSSMDGKSGVGSVKGGNKEMEKAL
jgi:hypothetical protein